MALRMKIARGWIWSLLFNLAAKKQAGRFDGCGGFGSGFGSGGSGGGSGSGRSGSGSW